MTGAVEHISQNLGVPFVYLKGEDAYLCENGVLFTKEEYLRGMNVREEYRKRSEAPVQWDYEKSKKKGRLVRIKKSDGDSILTFPAISLLLAFTAVGSMYISTLHTATYLYDYVDVISSWLMSACVTFYSATAFEVVLVLHSRKREFLAVIFAVLWSMVTLFSMATTVSVFYDRYNFNEGLTAEENREEDALKMQMDVLLKQEEMIRSAIDFKKKDIEYRQEKDYATAAVRAELSSLEKELIENMESQTAIAGKAPSALSGKGHRKESLFAFLGRLLSLEGGILEFVMSTLSAVFVNLIAPTAIVAVTELRKRKKLD